MKKTLIVYVGTDITFTSPTHPVSCAIEARRMIDRICALPDTRFEVRMNSEVGVTVLEEYGAYKGLNIIYQLNGKKSRYKAVIEDLKSGEKYLNKIREEINNAK